MKESKFIKIMNKLGVMEGVVTHIEALTGRYSITFTPNTTGGVDPTTEVGLSIRASVGSFAWEMSKLTSNVMKAYFKFNYDTHTTLTPEQIEELMYVDNKLSLATASYTVLEVVVCSEMLRVHIDLDNILTYFESLNVGFTIRSYLNGGWWPESKILTISEYIKHTGTPRRLTKIEAVLLAKIANLGDVILLSTIIDNIDHGSNLLRKISLLIDNDAADLVSHELVKCVSNLNGLPSEINLDLIATRVSKRVIKMLDKAILDTRSILDTQHINDSLSYTLCRLIETLYKKKDSINNVF